MPRLLLMLGYILLALLPGSVLANKTYYVYFMGGQSNMDGYGYVRDVPDELFKSNSRRMIFHGNMKFDNESNGGLGMWSDMQPGHGTGFEANGISNRYSIRFGPELSFAHRISTKTGKRIAIIKYALGGTGLAEGVGYSNWAPDFKEGKGINQYDNALITIRAAMFDRDLDNDGHLDTLVPAGIIWMQGEADAHHSQEAADAYQDNLKRLMDLFRAALHTDDLPVVIGKINRSGQEEGQMPFINRVQKAQQDFVDNDVCAAYVPDTENYGWSDPWHYDSDGYIKMGQAFAREVYKLQESCTLN